MGKTYSKDEEIIIAQTGSNQAEYSPLESHMQTYVLMMSIIVLLLALFIILYVLRAEHVVPECKAGCGKRWGAPYSKSNRRTNKLHTTKISFKVKSVIL